MSLLKANSVQIGQSATATNNFTLSVPSSPDGTIKLARGNSGATTADVLSVNASGAITGATISGATINSSTLNGGSITLGTAQNSTSGTAIDFTGIPSWAKRVTVIFSGLSSSGTSPYLVRLGTSSGVVSTGYLCGANVYSGGAVGSASNYTTGFGIGGAIAASTVIHGSMRILNISGNTWVEDASIGYSDSSYAGSSGGSISLSGTLDRISITTVNGTDTFDAGTINIMYEG